MDFGFSPEQEAIREGVARRLPPFRRRLLAGLRDEDGNFPREFHQRHGRRRLARHHHAGGATAAPGWA